MNRIERMRGHLIAQFSDKPVIDTLLQVVAEELNVLYSAVVNVQEKRWIDTGEGVQLDGIGRIINRGRNIDKAVSDTFFGFAGQTGIDTFGKARFRSVGEEYLATARLNDDMYRRILWAKVFYDISNGTIPDILQSTRKILNTESVSLVEINNANLYLIIGANLTESQILLMKELGLIVKGGGIGIKYIVNYNDNNYFGFKNQPNAKGFGVGEFARIVS